MRIFFAVVVKVNLTIECSGMSSNVSERNKDEDRTNSFFLKLTMLPHERRRKLLLKVVHLCLHHFLDVVGMIVF